MSEHDKDQSAMAGAGDASPEEVAGASEESSGESAEAREAPVPEEAAILAAGGAAPEAAKSAREAAAPPPARAFPDGKPTTNPYLAGVFVGLALLLSYLLLGTGLGASGALARVGAAISLDIARAHTLAGEYFGAYGAQPMAYYLVYMFAGIFFGGLFSALAARRVRLRLERGAKARALPRVLNALVGGLLVGFASRLAQGCTSGQALSGGALLLSGSLVFMLALFATGYLAAPFFRRQWHD